MSEELEQRLAEARERVRDLRGRLSRDTMNTWRSAPQNNSRASPLQFRPRKLLQQDGFAAALGTGGAVLL